jgi:hypothetical protein
VGWVLAAGSLSRAAYTWRRLDGKCAKMANPDNVSLHPTFKRKVPWLALPKLTALHPECRDQRVEVRVSEETLYQLYRANRKTPIWQAWAHLVGEMPPIPNASLLDGTAPEGSFGSLEAAAACFRGIKRPHRSEETGDSVIVYILNPTYTISFFGSMTVMAQVTRAPSDTVLAVYMRMQDALHPPIDGIFGIITGWEFVPCDASEVTLPEECSERYGEKLWR